MSNLTLSVLTTEYVKVPVTATVNGVAKDPTGDTVQMAFMAPNVNPTNTDWQVASWETISGTPYARCLVGPSGVITLAAGTYTVWVMVTDNPEVPVQTAANSLAIV